jgi:hypothetical protein
VVKLNFGFYRKFIHGKVILYRYIAASSAPKYQVRHQQLIIMKRVLSPSFVMALSSREIKKTITPLQLFILKGV